jgi:hypothetical protein
MSSFDDPPNPFRKALETKQVVAEVIACDHFRIHGGLAVESDFIVSVRPLKSTSSLFESFAMSKTYSAFRTFSQQLGTVTEAHNLVRRTYSDNEDTIPADCWTLAKYCQLVSHLIDSQRTRYIGKVNFMYVQVLAKERKKVLNNVLEATVHYFPSSNSIKNHEFVREVAMIIQTFFLTDHCVINPETKLPDHPEQRKHGSNHFLSAGGKLVEKGQALSNPLMNAGGRLLEKGQDLNPLSWMGLSGSDKDKGKDKSPRQVNFNSAAGESAPVVVPLSRRERRPDSQRSEDDMELAKVGDEARLLLDDDRPPTEFLPSYAHPVPVVRSGRSPNHVGTLIDNNPIVFLGISSIAIAILARAGTLQVRLDGDAFLLVVFACFCLGLHTPRPMVGGFDRPPTMMGAVVPQNDKSGRQLLRRSIEQKSTRRQIMKHTSTRQLHLDDFEDESSVSSLPAIVEPFSKFPEGATIGSHNNCWSEPDPANFEVRGANYLVDKKKVASSEFLFPSRGMDLFLTDTCPENVGKNRFIFGGKFREVPSFLINFRLPWGVLLLYFEIPKLYVPFVKAAYEDDAAQNLPSLDDMSPAERTVCRFLMKDQAHKNRTLKIVPVVVDGPWVVRSVVGGKPAIIGNKLPVQYHYEPASGNKELYLEADLDIAASSAARGILSVARSYTQILTLNLGFVVQGNADDELPERMLVGLRLHGIDPLTSPAYPVQPHDGVVGAILNADEESSEA